MFAVNANCCSAAQYTSLHTFIVAEQVEPPGDCKYICFFMSLSAFIVLCPPLLCSVATCIFLIHSYGIVLVVMLKTIKWVYSFASVRAVLLYAEVQNQMCAYCYC